MIHILVGMKNRDQHKSNQKTIILSKKKKKLIPTSIFYIEMVSSIFVFTLGDFFFQFE